MALIRLSKTDLKIVLDTNLLFPSSTRNLCVHLAIAKYFILVIPKGVLIELERTLATKSPVSLSNASKITSKLGDLFGLENAPVGLNASRHTSYPNDEFLVDFVSAVRPNFLVTRNTKDFSSKIGNTTVISGSAFLQQLFENNHQQLSYEIEQIPDRYLNPPVTPEQFLTTLKNQGFEWL